MRALYHVAIQWIGYQPILLILTKRCNTCTKDKPFDEFAYDNAQKDGYAGRCRQCKSDLYNNATPEEKEQRKAVRKASEDARREQIREADRLRHNTDKHRAKRRARNAEKREKRLLERQLNPPPPVPIPAFKICPKCEPPTEKPIGEFPISPDRKDKHGGWCKECCRKYHQQPHVKARRREREHEQGEAFKQKKYAGHKRWRERNLDKLRVQWREKYANDPVHARRMRRHTLRWIKAHPLEMQAHQMRRIARMKESTIEPVNLQNVLDRHGRYCYICEQDILPTQNLVFDHVIPLVPRPGDPKGTHSEDNLRPAHRECNGRKSNRRFEDLTPFDRRGPDKVV